MARLQNAPNPLPDLDTLNMLLTYDEGSGKLFWKERALSTFKAVGTRGAEFMWKSWKTRFAGKEAGGLHGGYVQCMINGLHYKAHRLIWKMKMGSDPIQIDHINGAKDDNRLSNLRDVSHQVNAKNRKLYENAASDMPGVSFHKRDKVWQVRISVGEGMDVHLGNYADKATAVAVRIAAQTLLDYHENHGRPSFKGD